MSSTPEKSPESRTITVAHSPDSDDAFMFYGLATNKLETEGLKFEHTLKDIQTLNEDAKNGVFDVTAIAFHAYAMFRTSTHCFRMEPVSATNTARSSYPKNPVILQTSLK